jgi:hypothetical protein
MTSSHKVIVVGAATPSAVVIADGSPMNAWIRGVRRARR